MDPRARVITWTALVLASWGLSAFSARAGEPAATPPAPATPPAADVAPADEIDPDAVALLKRFGKALEAEPKFSFAIDYSYDVVQEDGQKLEFGASRVYTVRRPDHLRIDEERRSGGPRELLFDGDRITVYIVDDKAYALANLKQHRDMDSMLDVIRDALDIPVPLGDLLRAKPLTQIEEGMQSAYIVGRETLAGTECDHVAWRTDEVDVEAWIRASDPQLLERVVINYRDVDGQPSFRAQFRNWNRSPDVADGIFVFKPTADVERVRFSVHGKDVQPPEEKKP